LVRVSNLHLSTETHCLKVIVSIILASSLLISQSLMALTPGHSLHSFRWQAGRGVAHKQCDCLSKGHRQITDPSISHQNFTFWWIAPFLSNIPTFSFKGQLMSEGERLTFVRMNTANENVVVCAFEKKLFLWHKCVERVLQHSTWQRFPNFLCCAWNYFYHWPPWSLLWGCRFKFCEAYEGQQRDFP